MVACSLPVCLETPATCTQPLLNDHVPVCIPHSLVPPYPREQTMFSDINPLYLVKCIVLSAVLADFVHGQM